MKRLSFLLIVLFLAGCVNNSEDIDRLFGYRYSIDETHMAPVIAGDSLVVTLQYEGCTTNHQFTLQYEEHWQDYTELWLFKNTPDQFCELVLHETRSFKLPMETFSAKKVYLLGPQGKRIRVRN